MLSQDWSTIAGPNKSISAGPHTESSQNTQQSTFTSLVDGSTSSFARRGTEDGVSSATGVDVTPTAINRRRGGGVRRATTSRGSRAVGRGRGQTSYGLKQHESINQDGDSSTNLATDSPTASKNIKDGGVGQITTSALGKHPRAEPDIDEKKQSRPRYFRDHEHKTAEPVRGEEDDDDAHIVNDIYMVKAMQEQHAGRYHVMTASDQLLAREVLTLRDRVRDFEREKEEALAKQRRQLRPGLVTVKMSSRIQERVNQLFGSTDNGTGSGTAWAGSLTPGTKTIQGGKAAISAWSEDVDDVTTHKDIETIPRSAPPSAQDTLETGPYLPPIGYFAHPRPRKGRQTLKRKRLNTKTRGNKSSKRKQSHGKTTGVHVHDSGEESDVPTESSWASSIPD